MGANGRAMVSAGYGRGRRAAGLLGRRAGDGPRGRKGRGRRWAAFAGRREGGVGG